MATLARRLLRSLILLCALALPAACRAPLPGAPWRADFETHYRRWWQTEFDAYQAGRESEQAPLPASARLPQTERTPASLPATVRAAVEFYRLNVEEADWGTVYLHRLVAGGAALWAVRVTTDGDDGWLELYSTEGEFLDGARSALELLAWTEEIAVLRAQVKTGVLPPELADWAERTLWQP